MALYDAADLVSRTKTLLNRPQADEAFTNTTTDDVLYQCVSEAIRRVNELLAWHVPEVAYNAPTQLTTSDNGLTYGFGVDADGNPIIPLGQIELRGDGPTGLPILPGNDWDDTTLVYLLDTDDSTGYPVVRWPGQRTRTFANGLWARYVQPPRQVTSSSSPVTLKPFQARAVVPYAACIDAATILEMDSSGFERRFNERWYELLAVLKTQKHGAGLQAFGGGSGVWWKRGVY